VSASCLLALLAWGVVCEVAGASALGREPILFGDRIFDPYAPPPSATEIRRLQVLPDGLIYHPYLAGPKESRTGIQFFSTDEGGSAWYGTVGGYIGLLRYGTDDEYRPVGIQFDVEGSTHYRSIGSDLFEFESSDVRIGFPLSIGWGGQETKLALYFLRTEPRRTLSEWRREQPERIFERQAIVLGHSIHLSENLRLYGEVGYAFKTDLNGEWELQFGTEYAPVLPTRIWGAPFAAANVYLLENEDFGGNLTLQAGWSWRGKNARLLRLGLFYSNGLSNIFDAQDRNEQQFGFGLWHDF
jgi:hypothetical protein